MGVELTSLASAEQLSSVRQIVSWCRAKRLTTPVLVMLESHRPVVGVLSFVMAFSYPFMPTFAERVAPILSSPAALELLLRELRDADGN